MTLSDIAAGIEVVDEQRDRGVATVDRTGASLAERFEPYAEDLPCDPGEAATLVETYADGTSVGASARVAGVTPTTGAKTLHLLGERVSPLGPTGRDVVRDWIDGRLSRSEAVTLAGVSERAFSLAAYVETHDPIDGAREAAEGVLAPDEDAALAKHEALGETMTDAGELL